MLKPASGAATMGGGDNGETGVESGMGVCAGGTLVSTSEVGVGEVGGLVADGECDWGTDDVGTGAGNGGGDGVGTGAGDGGTDDVGAGVGDGGGDGVGTGVGGGDGGVELGGVELVQREGHEVVNTTVPSQLKDIRMQKPFQDGEPKSAPRARCRWRRTMVTHWIVICGSIRLNTIRVH